MAVKKKSLTKKNVTTKKKTATKVARKNKATRKSSDNKSKTKSSKSKSNKKAFGGYAINFVGRKETVEQVFGKKPIAPSEMTKKIWTFVKENSLSNR